MMAENLFCKAKVDLLMWTLIPLFRFLSLSFPLFTKLAAAAAFVQHLSQVLYVDPAGKILLNCEYCFQEGVEDLSSLINTIMNCVQCIQPCTYYLESMINDLRLSYMWLYLTHVRSCDGSGEGLRCASYDRLVAGCIDWPHRSYRMS